MADTRPEALRQYVEAGFDLIPLHHHATRAKDGRPLGKAPRDAQWTERDYSEFDAAAHMQEGGNVGVRLRDADLVVDVDPRNFPEGETLDTDNPFRRLCRDVGLDPDAFPAVETGGGGLHVYMRKPSDAAVRQSVAAYPGVDFKSTGQVVAAGSVHPETGRLYEWGFLSPPLRDAPEAPAALLDLIERRAAPGSSAGGEYDADEVAHMLDGLNPEEFREHGEWLGLMMACHHASGGDARSEFVEWSTRDPKYADDAGKIGERWDSLSANRVGKASVTYRTLLKALTDRGKADLIPRTPPEDDFDDEPEAPAEPAPLPEIRVREGALVEMVEGAKRALFAAFPHEVLQRHGELVRPVRLGDRTVEGAVRRQAGATVLMPVTAPWLIKRMAASARWYRVTRQKAGADGSPGAAKKSPTDPSLNLANVVLHDQGDWPFHHVRGMVAAPTLDVRSGRVVDRPGIDPETGLLAVFDPDEFPEIERGVGREGATFRLRRVHDALFREMPFVDEPSRAVAMSALVTALVRPTMRAAPMHLFDAAMPGTGKSKMASVVGVTATGVEPSASAWATSEEENEKRIAALLRKGDPVVLFDNLDAARGDRVGGNILNIVLTQDPASIRILGKTEEETLNTRVTMLATGNNIAVVGDACRRAVKCRLDARCPDPERRRFDWDPVEAARAGRPRVVADILEALAAYVEAGRPDEPSPIGSFEDWTVVRGLLAWCGYADPAETMADVKATDAAKGETADALSALHDAFGDDWFTAADIEGFLADCETFADQPLWREMLEAQDAVRDRLLDGRSDKSWIGRELLKQRGVAAGDFYFEVEPPRKRGGARFRVTRQ